jgi:hypothetical protein
MNIPTDKRLCLAHETDNQPRKQATPPAWCERHRTCARHQAISQAPYDGSHVVATRVCQPGQHDAFIDRDAVESEGGEA